MGQTEKKAGPKKKKNKSFTDRKTFEAIVCK